MTALGDVSVAMIVLDEAPRLARLLPQLTWAGEIVVVDGGSHDDSVAIARGHGARIVQHPFDNFAAQRNRALATTRGRWVLSLDADEAPSTALISAMRRALTDGRHAAYHVPIRSRIFGRSFRYCGTQDDRPVRLFRRGAAEWVGDVHERLVVRGITGVLHGWLEHDTLPDVPSFLSKMHRYTTLAVAARLRDERGPRPGEQWTAPAWEIYRRLILKLGLLDGPQGWLFCLLSGLSSAVEVAQLRRAWLDRSIAARPARNLPPLPALTTSLLHAVKGTG